MEDSVVHRIGGVTALYVDSFVAPHVQTLLTANTLSASDREALDADLANTPLGRKIISLKVWRKDGHVLFSNDPDTMGRTFAVGPGLAQALSGNIFAEISERSDVEQTRHGQPLPRLIETYTPIHARHTGAVIAAAEFYERPDEVDREAGAAQRRSWLLVAGTMLTMYLLPELNQNRLPHNWWTIDLCFWADAWDVTRDCKAAVDVLNEKYGG